MGFPPGANAIEDFQRAVDAGASAFLSPSEERAAAARDAARALFSRLSSSVAADGLELPLPALHTDGLDAEQVWQQIEMQLEPLLVKAKRALKRLKPTIEADDDLSAARLFTLPASMAAEQEEEGEGAGPEGEEEDDIVVSKKRKKSSVSLELDDDDLALVEENTGVAVQVGRACRPHRSFFFTIITPRRSRRVAAAVDGGFGRLARTLRRPRARPLERRTGSALGDVWSLFYILSPIWRASTWPRRHSSSLVARERFSVSTRDRPL